MSVVWLPSQLSLKKQRAVIAVPCLERATAEGCTRNDPTKYAQSWGIGNTNGLLGRESRWGPWEREERLLPHLGSPAQLAGMAGALCKQPPCFTGALSSVAALRVPLSSRAWGGFLRNEMPGCMAGLCGDSPRCEDIGTDNLISLLTLKWRKSQHSADTAKLAANSAISAVGFH